MENRLLCNQYHCQGGNFVNKADLISAMAEKSGMTKKDSRKL